MPLSSFALRLAGPLIYLLLLTACSDSGSEPDGQQERALPVAAYEVEPQDLSRNVMLSAAVEPERVITISSRMAGLMNEVLPQEGDRVSAGEKLLQFDIEEQAARLERVQAELELSRAQHERSHRLLERNAISEAEYEEIRAGMRALESEKKLLQTQIAFGSVTAPSAGIILERYAEPGDAVSLHEPLFRLADLSRLVVRPGVPERDVVHLEIGQAVEVRIDAYPEEPFEGHVQRIFPSANADTRLIPVEISIPPRPDGRPVKPGFLARVQLQAEQRPDEIAIPSEALLASGRGERMVFVLNQEQRLESRPVETGIERRNWTQILHGLSPGEVIIGANPSNLREGALVEISRQVQHDSRLNEPRRAASDSEASTE